MSKHLASDLGLKIDRRGRFTVGTAARGQEITVLGYGTPIKMSILNKHIIVKPLVFENLSHDLNIGSHFLKKYNIDLKFSTKQPTFCFNDEKQPMILNVNDANLIEKKGKLELNDDDFVEKKANVDVDVNNFPEQKADIDFSVKSHDNLEKKVLIEKQGNTETPYDVNVDSNCNYFRRSRSLDKTGAKKRERMEPEMGKVFQLAGRVGSYALKSTIIKPNTFARVDFACPEKKSSKLPVLIEENGFFNETTFVTPGVYSCPGKIITLNVVNYGEKSVQIPRGCTFNGMNLLKPEYQQPRYGRKGQQVNELEEQEKQEEMTTRELFEHLKVETNPVLKQHPQIKKKLKELLYNYRDIFSTQNKSIGTTELVECRLKLKPGAVPYVAKARRFNPKQEEEINKQINKWLTEGVIEESESPWGANLVLVSKKDGTTRAAIDYRILNSRTTGDAFPLPQISDLLDRAAGHQVYSALDASQAYHVVKMEEDSKEMTAFIGPDNLYHFKKMPFGLSVAPAVYSRFVWLALRHLPKKNVNIYLDDVLLFTHGYEEHLEKLELLFEAHRRAGILIKPQKTMLFTSEVQYLGHMLSKDGIKMVPNYVQRILDWPIPTTVKQLNTMIGFFGYYSAFIPGYSDLVKEMNGQRRKKKLEWTEVMTQKLKKLKEAFRGHQVRSFPDYSSKNPFILTTDFSSTSVAAILSQVQNNRERLIACAGRRTTQGEAQYPSAKGELSALVYGLRKFRQILRYRPFVVYTDSSPLKYLTTMQNPGGLLGRWLSEISSFQFEVIHKKGSENKNADALSRTDHLRQPNYFEKREHEKYIVQMSQAGEPLDRENLINAQLKDMVLYQVRRWLTGGQVPTDQELRGQPEDLRRYKKILTHIKVEHDGLLSTTLKMNELSNLDRGPRPLIPEALKEAVFQKMHATRVSGHFGMNATIHRLRAVCFFTRMIHFVKGQVASCAPCVQKTTKVDEKQCVHRPMRASFPLETIYVDLVGPYAQTRDGFKYAMTCMDGFSRYVWAQPLKNKEADTVAQALMDAVITKWGCPVRIHSDNGKEFANRIFEAVCKLLQIEQTRTPPYNPSSNPVERFHRTLNAMIRTMLEREDPSWNRYLNLMCFAYNTRVSRSTGLTPFFALTGREAKLPIHLIMDTKDRAYKTNMEFVNDLSHRFKKIYDYVKKTGDAVIRRNAELYHGKETDFPEDSQVWYFCKRKVIGKPTKHTQSWLGPFKVTKMVNAVLRTIQSVQHPTKVLTTHVTRLKLFKGTIGNVPNNLQLPEDDDDYLAEEIRPTYIPEPCDLHFPVQYPQPQAEIQDKEDIQMDEDAQADPEPMVDPAQPVHDELEPEEVAEPTDMEQGEPKQDEDPRPSETPMEGQSTSRHKRTISESAPKGVFKKVKAILKAVDSSSEDEISAIQTLRIKLDKTSSVPKQATPGSCGFDISLQKTAILKAHTITRVDINLRMEMPTGIYAQIVARSSLASKGILTLAGTIDSDFRGHIEVVFWNTTSEDYRFNKGDRVAQIIFLQHGNPTFELVDDLGASDRMEGGFGSTNK